MKNKAFIITGTPGSGKTSVIRQLENQGYSVVHEAATDIIEEEQASGIECPWGTSKFIDKITKMQKNRQIGANEDIHFFDRSPFCTYALGKYLKFPQSKILIDEIDRCLKNSIYQNNVFFFENLGFVEHTDARKISYEDALIFEQIHLDVYKKFAFEIIMVPKLTVKQRCNVILERTI